MQLRMSHPQRVAWKASAPCLYMWWLRPGSSRYRPAGGLRMRCGWLRGQGGGVPGPAGSGARVRPGGLLGVEAAAGRQGGARIPPLAAPGDSPLEQGPSSSSAVAVVQASKRRWHDVPKPCKAPVAFGSIAPLLPTTRVCRLILTRTWFTSPPHSMRHVCA